MASQPQFDPKNTMLSEADYLATEPLAKIRREYVNGQAYAMAGASTNHNILAGNIFGEFRNHLKGTPCTTFMSDIRVRLQHATGNDYVYPDVLVDCSKIEGQSYFSNTPLLIVEVLSKSTRKHDLSTKLLCYINLPSLQEYLAVEQDFVQLYLFHKDTDWKCEHYFLGDTITLESIGLTFAVADIYERVENEEMDEFRQGSFVFDSSEGDGENQVAQ